MNDIIPSNIYVRMTAPMLVTLAFSLPPNFVFGQPPKPTLDTTRAEDIPFANQEKERPKLSDEERRIKTLTNHTNQEIERLIDFTDLDNDSIAKLNLELRPLIETTARAHSEFQPSMPPDLILDAVVESAKRFVTDKDVLVEYLDDLESRRTFIEKMAMQTYVYYIDSLTGLKTDQWQAVRQAGSRLLRQGDLNLVTLKFRDHQVPKADLKELSTILTQTQLVNLDKHISIWRGGDSADDLANGFRNVAEMKVQQLHEVVQLSDAQRQKLEFVSKKTLIPNVVRRRIVATKILRKFGEIIKNPEAEPLLKEMPLKEAMNLSTMRLPHLFADERWQSFIRTTLNEEQTQKWNQFLDQRTDAAIDTQASAIFFKYYSHLKPTATQQLAIHQLFRKAVQSQGAILENGFSLLPDLGILAVISQAEMQTAIGKDRWARVTDYHRQYFSKQ